MNIYLLILVSCSLLIGMQSDDKPKNVSFSPAALDKLILTQELIRIAQERSSDKCQTSPALSSHRQQLVHCDSAPDRNAEKVDAVRGFKHLKGCQQAHQGS